MGETKKFNIPDDINMAFLKSLLERFKKRFGPKALIFLFFVFLSTMLWISLVLGDNYYTNISFPVRYYNFPKDKVLVNDLPESLDIRVYATGNVILKYKIQSQISPIAFDVNSFSLMSGNEKTSFYVLTDMARQKIQNQLSADIQIVEISPDTLNFELAGVVSKQVDVVPDIQYSIAKQYIQKGDIKLEHDSVTVSGPSNLVDTIEHLKTELLQLAEISDTINGTLEFPTHEKLSFKPEEIGFSIFAERYTEASMQVPIQPINLPDSLSLKLFPKNIEVRFRVGLSDFEKLTPGQFRVTVDYQEVLEEKRKLRVNLATSPAFIEQTRVYPQFVEYIVER